MCIVSRRVLNRMQNQLLAHAQLTSAAVTRYRSAVDHVTRHIDRFERHLTDTLDTKWLSFPAALLNQSLASVGPPTSRVLQLASLLDVDEVNDVYSWKDKFWKRFLFTFCLPVHFDRKIHSVEV